MTQAPTSYTNVLLGVTGSIAAYKAVELARLLIKQGRNLNVVLTRGAERFVGAQTFAGIVGRPVHGEMFGPVGGELHVQLAKNADCMLVAPCTADTIARLAHGRADDLLSATALCFEGPLFVAPAMHPNMWSHPATSHNVEVLRRRGVRFLGPALGPVASGDEGLGRMLEPVELARSLRPTKTDLQGKRIIVSAGPTVEDLDPVRFISNRSSGKMGFAIAERAAARGAEVCLVSGPVNLSNSSIIERRDVRTGLQLLETLQTQLSKPTDALFMTAAVGDFRAKHFAPQKFQRDGDMTLDLIENPDVIATLGKARKGNTPTLVAFAVETGSDAAVIARAREKLARKNVDIVVANHADEAFGRDDNRIHLVEATKDQSLPTMTKLDVADVLLDWLLEHWSRVRR